MEALEFLKEVHRMCIDGICGPRCPAFGRCCFGGIEVRNVSQLEEVEEAIEQWSKDHPIITNACKFKEVFGLEPYNDRCPPFATNDYCKGRNCSDCKSWWDEPYKEPEHED